MRGGHVPHERGSDASVGERRPRGAADHCAATAEFGPRTIADAPPGTILIWDSLCGMLNADAIRKVQIKDILDHGWVLGTAIYVIKE